MTINNHDAWCIDWYKRLISDGTAEDGQRIAVEMHDQLKATEKELSKAIIPQQLEEWHEDDGAVLWWKFPIEEPPYCGSPLDCNWPGYHTHWTELIMPIYPNVRNV